LFFYSCSPDADIPQLCLRPDAETPTVMTLSQEGVRFIEQHEGNAGTLPANQRLTGDIYGLYNDSAGHYSEGIGHLVHQGRYTTQGIVDYYNRHPSGETQAEA
jgi:hypothetical protein